MKQFLFSFIVTMSGCGICAQTNIKPASLTRQETKTRMITQTITVAPPPSVAQYKTGLTAIKKRTSALTDKQLQQVNYWNAGAPAYRWNQIAPSLISWQNVDVVLRVPAAWMNIAIYDATVIAWKEKIKYKRQRPGQMDKSIRTVIDAPSTFSYPCEHSVTAAAAANVLAYFWPAKADSVLKLARAASQSRVDAGVQFQVDVDAGWKLGEEVAKQIIEQAKHNATQKWQGAVNKDPKKWTGPYALGIDAQTYKPIAMRTADQFRPAPPPDFAQEMKDLKEFKQTFRSRSLAYFWASTGPSHWNDIASQKMFEYGIQDDALEASRMYTALNVAFHDATIAIMDAKYAYWGIRPAQYDTAYQPLLQTPPFPGYPSGHAAGAGATAGVLEYFFPAHAKEFRQIAQDCADSRFYAGIHFKSDNEVGLEMGLRLGRFVAHEFDK